MNLRRISLRDSSLLLLFAVLVVLYPAITNAYMKFVLITAIINCTLVVGLHFIFGLTGQLHIGMAAFWGIGSYLFALAITRLGWTFWTAMGAAALGVGLVGFLLGFPTLRLKGFYLAITTIGFGEIVRLILLNWAPVTGGVFGIAGLPRPTLGPLAFGQNQPFYYLSLAILALLTLAARTIEDSKFGRAFRAIHDDELAAEAVGLNSTYLKILAFVLCGLYAGIGGGLYASLMQYISPEVYALERSQMLIMMLVIGGMGSLPGALMGTVLLTFLPEVLRFLKIWYLAVYGAIVILIIVYRPTGLWGLWELLIRQTAGLFRRKEKSHGVA
ncbi:MAG TPA: branched-chain amino acid ABC transporter permease [Firmicutes bacterium]|nr:branched-chain amino acid ABC transporter permease [Bacillota bacterium]